MTQDLYVDIDFIREDPLELRANLDFARYVETVRNELLKKLDKGVLDSIEPQLNALGWVKERMCHNTHKNRWFECSECGYSFIDLYPCDETDINEQPHYCLNCGAKVAKG